MSAEGRNATDGSAKASSGSITRRDRSGAGAGAATLAALTSRAGALGATTRGVRGGATRTRGLAACGLRGAGVATSACALGSAGACTLRRTAGGEVRRPAAAPASRPDAGGGRRQLVNVHHATGHVGNGRIDQKSVGAGDFARAPSRHRDRDDGLIHRTRHLQTHRRGAARQLGQRRHPHPGLGNRCVAKRHICRDAGRGNICPLVGLHIKDEIDRSTKDDGPRLCPSEMAAALPTTTQHPAPKITLRNFTKISFFGVVIFAHKCH